MTTPSHTAGARPADATAKAMWRVRTDKGDVFGPADIDTLKAWARDGRLAPTNAISDDGQTWTPVTTRPELEMDWVAEVTSGSFYGPIHKDALAELVREASISAAAPLFHRSAPSARLASEREQALEARLQEVQQHLYARVGELEGQLNAARGESEQSRSLLSARDLEFDAERQEQRASGARLQAELLKRDGRIAALEKDVQRLEQAARDRQALETRLVDAERQTAEHQRLREQALAELEQVRALHRELERNSALLRERAATHEQETQSLRDTVRAHKLRLESARKLLQQAASAVGGSSDVTDAELVDSPPPGATKDGPPPLATPAGGGAKPGMSLADLEAQAQRELRQLGGKGAALFKGRGSKG